MIDTTARLNNLMMTNTKIQREANVFIAKLLRKKERKLHRHFRANLNYTFMDKQMVVPDDMSLWGTDLTDSLWAYTRLREYRVTEVRQYSRHLNLAIAYMSGKRYDEVEEIGSRAFDAEEVADIVCGVDINATETTIEEITDHIEEWAGLSKEDGYCAGAPLDLSSLSGVLGRMVATA